MTEFESDPQFSENSQQLHDLPCLVNQEDER